MSQTGDKAQNQQNIDEVLELLKQSYTQDEGNSTVVTHGNTEEAELSEAELREKLRMQFMSEESNAEEAENSSYIIDEDFLKEAETVKEPEIEELSEIKAELDVKEEPALEETLVLEEVEEPFVYESTDADELDYNESFEHEKFEALYDITEKKADTDVEEESFFEDDSDLTFEDIEETEEESDITYTTIDLNSTQPIEFADEDITFDDLDIYEQQGDEPVLTKLELEPEEPSIVTVIERATPEYFKAEAQKKDADIFDEVGEFDCEEGVEQAEEDYGEDVEDDFLSEFFSHEAPKDENKEPVLDSITAEQDEAELSLLMQFGCEEELLSGEVKAEIVEEEFVYEERTLNRQELCEKLRAKKETYSKKRGSVLVRLSITAILAFILFIYEILPIFGVKFPGLLNIDENFIPYLLLGMPMILLCGVLSYKQIWDGMKKIFTKKADPYSIFVPIAISVLFYDIVAMFNGEKKPPVFHFMLACVLVTAIVWELLRITSEKRSFEFFLGSLLTTQGDMSTAEKEYSFTLCKSRGKNSTAEKMYAGGLDPNKNIYYPLEISENSLENCLNALKARSKKSEMPFVMLLPSMIFSLIIGFVALIVAEEFWIFPGAIAISLLLTLPIVAILAVYLPFERINARNISQKYAFASEAGMEELAGCDMLVFEDLHLFKKASPAHINLALYDATTNQVLLGCLDAIYSKIGGPMSGAFSKGNTKGFKKCEINRIAKSGVEAIVENNYSVLVGNEVFMARYGISFPNVVLNNADDKVFTLCVSINGRATARIAVRYEINEMFEMFAQRLHEDGIYCVIETYDPMISTELLSKLLPKGHIPMSIVHLNVLNYKEQDTKVIENLIFGVGEQELKLAAHSTRLNLAPALSVAKRMKRLRLLVNILSIGMCALGAVLAFLMVFFNITAYINELYIFIFQLLGMAGLSAFVIYEWVKKDRYSYQKYLLEKQAKSQQTKR